MEEMRENGNIWVKFFHDEKNPDKHYCDYSVEEVEERDLMWFVMFLYSKTTDEGKMVLKDYITSGKSMSPQVEMVN